MKLFAFLRFSDSVSSYELLVAVEYRVIIYHTCSASQHTGPVFHFGPHNSTSCVLTSSSGSFASPLSGQGRAGEKNPELPHVPRMAHLPASCFGVNNSPDTRLSSPAAAVKCLNTISRKRCAASQYWRYWRQGLDGMMRSSVLCDRKNRDAHRKFGMVVNDS